ncbi:MAG TPA: carbonate dehydratase [Steroidobacteraceae bacterium]
MTASKALESLLASNRQWAAGLTGSDPQYFTRLAHQQLPQYLWIGCSDSRVPANQILGLMPGEIFVHRNVANVVVHSDLNCLSVIQYALDVLKVRDIIVCGHYGCGGVSAALRDQKLGLIDNWLRHVQDVRDRHVGELAAAGAPDAQLRRLCELNVLAQTVHVGETTLVQDAWRRGQPVAVHGLIYGLDDGILRHLGLSLDSDQQLAAYKESGPAAPGSQRAAG